MKINSPITSPAGSMLQELIIYEDPALMVLNKPACLHSTAGKNIGNSLADCILDALPEQSAVSPNPADAGLVQRLDFETSGCILLARSSKTWHELHAALTSGLAEKTYLFLAEGTIETGEVHTSIGSRYRGSKKVTVYPLSKMRKRAQPARTRFKLLHQPDGRVGCVEGRTTTGRRHQIRAHAAYHGHPLVGDRLYGAQLQLPDFEHLLGSTPAPSFLLHADSLRFVHPENNKEVFVKAPLPDYCQVLFEVVPEIPARRIEL